MLHGETASDDVRSIVEPEESQLSKLCMKQVVLLAGLHKTATTSIQRYCAANLPALQAAGFNYLLTTGGQEAVANHTTLMHYLFRADPTATGLGTEFAGPKSVAIDTAIEKARTAVSNRLARSRRNMLFVAEGVSLFSVEELARMRTWFAEQGWQIRLICHVRRLFSWINSMIAQRVTAGPRLTIADAVQEFARNGTIVRGRLENLRSVFPHAEVYSYELATEHLLGPVGFFLQRIGVDVAGAPAPVRANEGASGPAVRVISMLNERFGRYHADGSLNPNFAAAIAGLRQIGGSKFLLTATEATPLAPLLQADNEWLTHTFGEDFREDNLAFPVADAWKWDSELLERCALAVGSLPPQARRWCESRLLELHD